ncbi:MAG: hypothetical protein KDK05_28000 [Candidatus Competibacteraceae bacterium]|nr:hypothetical protein [Candidatus Competibacteraceae bacterium]MCB1807698.1 hypothetical protein [Candidatus Competibacteraceae bacterium]
MNQTTLDAEHQLSLIQHDNRQALDILARALAITEQVMRGEKSTAMLTTATDHIRAGMALIDSIAGNPSK